MLQPEDEYIVSIRITFPEAVSSVLMREKNRFVSEYGSSYKSEPHITLYLARYTPEGFSKLIPDLRNLPLRQLSVSLLDPKVVNQKGLRNFYIVDISNKEQLQELHAQVLEAAARYRSPLLREKSQKRLEQGLYNDAERENLHRYGSADVLHLFDPHVTLGEVGVGDPQPELADVQENLKQIVGEEIAVSSLAVFFHRKRYGEEKAALVEEVIVPFRS